MKNFFLSIFFLILSFVTAAQGSFSFSGTVSDASSGEDLIGATVYAEQLKLGTITNSYGIFSMSLKH